MPTPLEDKEAIRELFSEYCFRMDEFRFTALGELFTEDGEWIAPYSQARGPTEIAALMARTRSPLAVVVDSDTMLGAITLDALVERMLGT